MKENQLRPNYYLSLINNLLRIGLLDCDIVWTVLNGKMERDRLKNCYYYFNVILLLLFRVLLYYMT
jgi:hypothetical protein